MKSKILTLAVALLGAFVLRAQDQNVSTQIDFVSWGEDLYGLEVRSGQDSTPAQALAFRYSKSVKYSGSATLMLALGKDYEEAVKRIAKEYEEQWRSYLEEEGLDASIDQQSPQTVEEKVQEGDIPKPLAIARDKDPELAALVKLPPNSKRVTILLLPGPKRSLMARVFNDDPSLHPLGKVRVHNLSQYPISLRSVSGKSLALKPGKSATSSPKDNAFIYELSYQVDGVWKVQENNMIGMSPTDQMHMIILRSDASFFTSSDGSRGGFMQACFLQRRAE
jgi:hypothetical protein